MDNMTGQDQEQPQDFPRWNRLVRQIAAERAREKPPQERRRGVANGKEKEK